MRLLSMLTAAALSLGAVTASAEVTFKGSGASFPAPLYKRWLAEYNKLKPEAKADYDSSGSGQGIKDFTAKIVAFGASDAPMSKKEVEGAGGPEVVVQIPTVAGGVVPAYNLPDVKEPVNFTGEILADIFIGKINKWNDPALVAINPQIKLPDLAITPATRSDGSGTNFVFTSYLSLKSESFSQAIGIGKQVNWKIGQSGKGSNGVTAIIKGLPGAIGYVESNFADQSNLPYGAIKNQAGKFVKATPDSVSKAGEGATESMKGNRLTADIWDQTGDGTYPISSFTYVLLYKDLRNVKSADEAQTLVDFLWWATHDGQKFAPEMGYAPLAPAVLKKVEDALRGLTFEGKALSPAAAK